MKLPIGKSRLDLVKEGLGMGVEKRGRLIVSVARILEDPRNERKTFRNMEGFIASIKAVGLVEPITVTPEGESYRILTGHRRYRAAVAAGLDRIEVLIRDPEEESVRRRKSVVSNVQREDLGPVELAEALQALMEEDDEIKTQDDLARAIGKTKTWVSRILRILDLPADLQQKVALAQQLVPYDAVATIARLEDRQEQTVLIDALIEGTTQREIRERVNGLRGSGRSSGNAKPKHVYETSHKAMVIIQSMNSTLEPERRVRALEEALSKARDELKASSNSFQS
jgi:ParB/RepB/Spo0J family partition protein